MDSAERFAVIFIFMFGFFVSLGECSKMIKPELDKSEPVEPVEQVEPIYIHGTITKPDTIIKIDTIIIHEPIKN